MREYVERLVDADGRPVAAGAAIAAGWGGRRVTVNVAESPLAWLRARAMIDPRQFEAGERLRGDYETAQLGPRVTMRWVPRVDASHFGSSGGSIDPALAQVAAKRRFDAAVAAAGPGLSDILWRVVCAGEGLPVAEKALGWPARAGRVVLTLALDRVAAHYGSR